MAPRKAPPAVPSTAAVATGGAAIVQASAGTTQLCARTPSGTDSSAQTPQPSPVVAGSPSQAGAGRASIAAASTPMVTIEPPRMATSTGMAASSAPALPGVGNPRQHGRLGMAAPAGPNDQRVRGGTPPWTHARARQRSAPGA